MVENFTSSNLSISPGEIQFSDWKRNENASFQENIVKGSCPIGVEHDEDLQVAWILCMFICQARNLSWALTWRFEFFHDKSRPHLIISINRFHKIV